VLQIHDELMFEINQEALESVAPKIKKLMESVLTPEETGGVPIIVTSEAGPNWAELEKI
jgi:DNA polymerase-1